MAYFLISVSNRTNLDLCIKHALAGFTNSINGLWTFVEIQEGDFVSFLYGARVFNLYKVLRKVALKNADTLPPWLPVTFRMSGKTYYFPFRLYLSPIREFTEPMVRPEFAYVAENLLLRGGYRKTHFQGDQTTLQALSQMGDLYNGAVACLSMNDSETFTPMLTWNRELISPPELFYFQELILQSLIRRWLSRDSNLQALLDCAGLNSLQAKDFEVLGEKALPEGHIDILIKDRIPTGYSRKIILEVKTGAATPRDVAQLRNYMNELGQECVAGMLVCRAFSRKVRSEAENNGVGCAAYSIGQISEHETYPLDVLETRFLLSF